MSNYIFSLVVGAVLIGLFYLFSVFMGAFIDWEAPAFSFSEWTLMGRFGFFCGSTFLMGAAICGAWERS